MPAKPQVQHSEFLISAVKPDGYPPPEKPEIAGAGGAYGKTDSQGRYSLKTVIGDKSGTAPGKYKVTISLSRATPNNPDGPEKELIPTKYNAKSDLTFDVPPGGTDRADFTLTK